MLTLRVSPKEYYDSLSETFVDIPGCIVKLEHSLLAISKWESVWHKPFISNKEKERDEVLHYIECMLVDEIDDTSFINYLSQHEMNQIEEYIGNPYTATTINNPDTKPNRDVITSELIYYWMVAGQIPFEAEKWHINRLFMLLNICGIKNNPPKKQSAKTIMSRNRALNEARKKSMGTSG